MIVGRIAIPALGRLARGEALLTIDGAEGETVLDEADARELLSELILTEDEQADTEESNVITVDFRARRRTTTEDGPAEQAPTEKEDPQTAATVQGSMKTNAHEGLKMNTNVSANDAQRSTLELDFHAPKKPRGWKADKESQRLYGSNEASGPKFYVAGGAAGAWATWEESMGIYFVLDCNDSVRFTLDEMRACHAGLGAMLDQVEAAMVR